MVEESVHSILPFTPTEVVVLSGHTQQTLHQLERVLLLSAWLDHVDIIPDCGWSCLRYCLPSGALP